MCGRTDDGFAHALVASSSNNSRSISYRHRVLLSWTPSEPARRKSARTPLVIGTYKSSRISEDDGPETDSGLPRGRT